jgi:hypothetical protein
MKSIKSVLLGVLGFVMFSALAYAGSVDRVVAVSVNSPDNFNFVQSSTYAAFGYLNPGAGSLPKSIGLTVTNNRGATWSIQIVAGVATRVGGTETLPASAIQYNITGSGVGTYTPTSGAYATAPQTATTIYACAGSEGVVTGLNFQANLKAIMPSQGSVAGEYACPVTFTLLDGI